MTTEFHLGSRKNGKTTRCVEGFLQHKDNILVVVNQNMLNTIRKNFNLVNGDNIIVADKFGTSIVGRHRPNTIFIDDYLWFKNQEIFYEHLITINPKKVIVHSSMPEPINFVLAKIIRKRKTSLGMFIDEEFNDSHFKYLYDNLLTSPETVIV